MGNSLIEAHWHNTHWDILVHIDVSPGKSQMCHYQIMYSNFGSKHFFFQSEMFA